MVVLYAWLLADFISGVGHWIQDKLLDIETAFNFTNRIKADNDLHHEQPAAMVLKCSLWDNVRDSVYFGVPVAAGLYLGGAPTVAWLAVAFSTVANGVHRFAHIPPARQHWIVKGLQRTGIIISFNHHAQHHWFMGQVVLKEEATRNYCVMTNWLNPLLDAVGFWSGLEWLCGRGVK